MHPHDDACTTHEHTPHSHDLLPDAALVATARRFAALGDPSRLRLVELLLTGRHCVSELVTESQEAMSSISQRLKTLHDAGLLKRTREGKHIYYEIADAPTHNLLLALLAHDAPVTQP